MEIYLGYNGDLKLEFKGYIDVVSANYPITLKLEDEMWKLKQIPVNFVSPNISLKDFFEKVVKDYPLDIDMGVSLGAVRFSKVTLGEVMNKLQSEMSLYSFIRNGKLTVANFLKTSFTFCLSKSLIFLGKISSALPQIIFHDNSISQEEILKIENASRRLVFRNRTSAHIPKVITHHLRLWLILSLHHLRR